MKTHLIPACSVSSELRQCVRWSKERAAIAARKGRLFLWRGSLAQSHTFFQS